MCGRYTLRATPADLAEHFDLPEAPEWSPRFNVAPTQTVPVVRLAADRPGHEWSALRWGLVPSWADDPAIGSRLINARAETVAEKPSFRSAFKSRRCLMPADGFYEWAVEGKGKRPHHFTLEGGGVFVFAGLWERWGRGTESLETCALLTVEANAVVAPIHARMPLILPPEAYDAWLNPDSTPVRLAKLLLPYPGPMADMAVGLAVNRPGHEGPGCLAPAG